MRKSLQKELTDKYPKIFQNKEPTANYGGFGIECPDAWAPLIKELCSTLQFNADANGYPQAVADQVKEKFGTLRFYYHLERGDDGRKSDPRHEGCLDGLIRAYEDFSSMICAECGSNDDVRPSEGWIVYRCAECRARREEERAGASSTRSKETGRSTPCRPGRRGWSPF